MINKYKILFKFASRSRSKNFFSALDNILENISDLDNFCILISLDTDDETMNNPKIYAALKKYLFEFCGLEQPDIDSIAVF